MKRIIAGLTALSLAAIASPAAALEPLEGDVAMSVNPGWATGTGPCPEVTWAGSLELTDTDGLDGTYGLVLTYNDVPGVMRGDWYLFQENWAVTTEVPEFDADGMVVTCMPGTTLMSGYDAGVSPTTGNEFWDVGFVEETSAPFDAWLGARTYQDGILTFGEGPDGAPVPLSYVGTFRLE